MNPPKPTRRLVIGTIAAVLDHVANVFPRNVFTLEARIDGPRAARVLDDMADALRDLEDCGVTATWESLVERGYHDRSWEERL